MQTALLFIDTLFYAIALVFTVKRVKRENPRMWLRVVSATICVYEICVYGGAFLGLIPESYIPQLARWFQIVIALYFIQESRYG